MDENLKKYIDELISEIQNELDEATATGNVAGYNVPGAFSNGGSKDKNRKKKIATQFGMKIVGKMDESFMSDLDIIKKGSKDITDFVKRVLSDKQFKEVRTDKDFHKYLKSFYNESVVSESNLKPKKLTQLKKGEKFVFNNTPYEFVELYTDINNSAKVKKEDGKTSVVSFGGGIVNKNTKGGFSDYLKQGGRVWDNVTPTNSPSVNEGPMDRIFGGIPYTKKGKQSIVTMKLPDDVKQRIIQRAKKEGKVAKPNMSGGVTVFESVNESLEFVVNTYRDGKSYIGYYDSRSNQLDRPKFIPKPYGNTKDAIKVAKKLAKSNKGKYIDDFMVLTSHPDIYGKPGDIKESVNEAKVQRPVNRWLELKNDETLHPHKKMAMGLKELKYQLGETQKFFNWYNKIKTMNELDSSDYWKRTQSHIYKIKERLVNIARTIQEIEK